MRTRGATLVEAAAAVAVLAIAATIAVGAVGSALPQAFESETPVSAVQLARDLMDEVLSKPFNDPNGVDGETVSGLGARDALDDMDDYDELIDSPPKGPTGVLIPGAARFSRRVNVIPIAGDSGGVRNETTRALANFLKVEVEVSADGGLVARLTGLKADPGKVVPAPRSGLVYKTGSRQPGAAETLRVAVQNRTGAPITVQQMRIFWTPAEVEYFRAVTVDPPGATSASATAGTTYFASGQLITLNTPITLATSVDIDLDVGHFRQNQSGTGPAGHTDDNAFTIFWISGSNTYQTDIGIGE